MPNPSKAELSALTSGESWREVEPYAVNMSTQQTSFEREMARRNNSVVTIKNIDNEDFSHNYDGFPYAIKAGEVLPFPYPVAMLLARHLAMKVVRKESAKQKDFKGNVDRKAINLYAGKALQPVLDKIITSRIDKPLPAHKSEGQVMAERTKEIQKEFPKEVEKPAVDKKDVIADLRKRNIKFDVRASKEELLGLLVAAEMEGNDGEPPASTDQEAEQQPPAQQ